MEKDSSKRFKPPRLKVRVGVYPTRVEKDKTKYTRKQKHKLEEEK